MVRLRVVVWLLCSVSFRSFVLRHLVIAPGRNNKKVPSYMAKNKYMTKKDLELDQGWLEVMERALKRRVGLFRQ